MIADAYIARIEKVGDQEIVSNYLTMATVSVQERLPQFLEDSKSSWVIFKASGTSKILFRIKVEHPRGTVVDERDWATYLNFYLLHHTRLINGSYSYVTTGGSDGTLREHYSVSTQPSFGYYFFKLQKGDETFGILVDRDVDYPRPKRMVPVSKNSLTKPYHGVIQHPFDHNATGYHVAYNDDGLSLVEYKPNGQVAQDDRKFVAEFRQRLSPAEVMKIYVEGFSSLKMNPDMFQRTHPSNEDLTLYKVMGFEFFTSLREDVIICLQDHQVKRAYFAITNLISSKTWEADMRPFKEDATHLVADYGLAPQDRDNFLKVMKGLIEIIRKMLLVH